MRRSILVVIALSLLLGWGGSLMAGINTFVFDSPEDEARFKKLAAELRCLSARTRISPIPMPTWPWI